MRDQNLLGSKQFLDVVNVLGALPAAVYIVSPVDARCVVLAYWSRLRLFKTTTLEEAAKV
jgi:hypothetical protein